MAAAHYLSGVRMRAIQELNSNRKRWRCVLRVCNPAWLT
jgi:hypothetical protein